MAIRAMARCMCCILSLCCSLDEASDRSASVDSSNCCFQLLSADIDTRSS